MAIISYNFQRLPSEDQDQISVVWGASLGTFWYRGWSSHDPEGTWRLFLPQLLDGVPTSLQEKYRRFLHISSYIIIYHHISSYMIIIYHCISSYIIIYHHLSSFIIIHHHVSSHIITYHHISSHIITYNHISSYIIIWGYHHISSYSIIYHISIQQFHGIPRFFLQVIHTGELNHLPCAGFLVGYATGYPEYRGNQGQSFGPLKSTLNISNFVHFGGYFSVYYLRVWVFGLSRLSAKFW